MVHPIVAVLVLWDLAQNAFSYRKNSSNLAISIM
jgi:hypothetical protein